MTRKARITEMVAEYFGGYVHTGKTSPEGQYRWLAENVVAYFELGEDTTPHYTHEIALMVILGELKFLKGDSGTWYFELPDRR